MREIKTERTKCVLVDSDTSKGTVRITVEVMTKDLYRVDHDQHTNEVIDNVMTAMAIPSSYLRTFLHQIRVSK